MVKKTLTYLDTGVLIAAWQGTHECAEQAYKILDDAAREFAASPFLRLELIPKPTFHNKRDEIQFYETFFGDVRHWPTDLEWVTEEALRLACVYDLTALDALHLASASQLGAEFMTTEKSTKPMFGIKEITVVSIR
ncbi:MAG: type II toxin-antitoxin system VapC family toxin [Bradymonadaceae bacterium]